MTEKKETRGRKSNRSKGLPNPDEREFINTGVSPALFKRLEDHVKKIKRVRNALLVEIIENYLDSPAAKLREKAEEKIENL